MKSQLTAEHIPPQNAFNKGQVKIYNLIDSTLAGQPSWDNSNIFGEISQNGFKLYTLCSNCNNKTGSWYGLAYGDFVRQVEPVITIHKGKPNEMYSGIVKETYPLRVFKQILSMFCSVNYGFIELDPLRKFVNQKEACYELSDFRVYTYIQPTRECKIIPLQTKLTHNADMSEIYSQERMSEISVYPLGFILSVGSLNNSELVDITDFAKCAYGNKCDVELQIPVKERNSPYMGDFRTKGKITGDGDDI